MDISGSLWDKARKVDRTAQNLPDESFFQMARALFGEMIVTPSEPGDGEDKATTMIRSGLLRSVPHNHSENRVANMLGNLTATATVPNRRRTRMPHCRTEPPSGRHCPHTAIRHCGRLVRELSRIAFRDVIRRDDTAIGVTECQVREMPDSL